MYTQLFLVVYIYIVDEFVAKGSCRILSHYKFSKCQRKAHSTIWSNLQKGFEIIIWWLKCINRTRYWRIAYTCRHEPSYYSKVYVFVVNWSGHFIFLSPKMLHAFLFQIQWQIFFRKPSVTFPFEVWTQRYDSSFYAGWTCIRLSSEIFIKNII